jgi:hypothetical protein
VHFTQLFFRKGLQFFWFRASSSFSRSMPARSLSSSCIGVSPSPSPRSSMGGFLSLGGGRRSCCVLLCLLQVFVRILDFFFFRQGVPGSHKSFLLRYFVFCPWFCLLGGFLFLGATVVKPSFCAVSSAWELI